MKKNTHTQIYKQLFLVAHFVPHQHNICEKRWGFS